MVKSDKLQQAGQLILDFAGQVNEEVLHRTPKRFEESWRFLLSGYQQEKELKRILTTFEKEGTQHLVAMTNIDFFSICEHHLLPFFGKAHIGYIPRDKIVGASKLPRIVKILSRQLQLQERLTHQIAFLLEEYLTPLGVAIILEGKHLCIAMRGVESTSGILVTSEMLGVFQNEPSARAEFLSLCKR